MSKRRIALAMVEETESCVPLESGGTIIVPANLHASPFDGVTLVNGEEARKMARRAEAFS